MVRHLIFIYFYKFVAKKIIHKSEENKVNIKYLSNFIRNMHSWAQRPPQPISPPTILRRENT